MKTRVGRPSERSESRLGQRVGAEGERMKREETWYEDERRETSDETSDERRETSDETSDEIGNAGTRTLDETRGERTLRGYEDAMPGTLRPGLTRGNEKVREGKVVKSR